VSRIWDVVVVGAGHAGCEAALAAARVGCDVLVLTGNVEAIAAMACNCSIGGPAKAHLVREIDALGGEMARNIDRTYSHVRMLNTTKGPAVQALRAQADKALYREQMKRVLETTPRIALMQQMVVRIGAPDKAGEPMVLWTQEGERVLARRVVLTPGTFLNGLIHIGADSYSAGRAGEPASLGLSESLREMGLPLGRLKTGTVPRVNLRSICVDGLVETPSDPRDLRFSLDRMRRPGRPLLPCWRTSTTERTMGIVGEAMDGSALGSGRIRGTGPRYCPSLETKLLRFPDRVEHGVFLEREGWNTEEVYVQGTPNSLPTDVQREMLASIPGLETAEMTRPGYAIEYDYVMPASLTPSLQCRDIPGLYLAGQINGSSGYEEAAAQGLTAGANAALSLRGMPELLLGRDEAYMGVLVDDLVHRHADEPYRLLTSRAEWRLQLSQDTAHARLTEKAFSAGLVSQARRDQVRRMVDQAGEGPQVRRIACGGRLVDGMVEDRRLYDGYRQRTVDLSAQRAQWERIRLPEWLDLARLPVKAEVRERLVRARPRTIADAIAIPGITEADISTLLTFVADRASNVSRETLSGPEDLEDE
jgi:tRNA uridine 5-carboxymethylaminomethyl modification enzyme